MSCWAGSRKLGESTTLTPMLNRLEMWSRLTTARQFLLEDADAPYRKSTIDWRCTFCTERGQVLLDLTLGTGPRDP